MSLCTVKKKYRLVTRPYASGLPPALHGRSRQTTALLASPATTSTRGRIHKAAPTNPRAVDDGLSSCALVFFLMVEEMLLVGTVSSLLMAAVASCSSFRQVTSDMSVYFCWTHGQQRWSCLNCAVEDACDADSVVISVVESGAVVLSWLVTLTEVPVSVLS